MALEFFDSEFPSPAISVIVTSYNYGFFLPDALGSVKAQSFEDWECIIVDDGSDDDTPEIAQEWADRDQRFVYLRQENAGPSAARNAGLRQARGRYIQILDADDTIMPEKFDVQARLLGSLPENSLVYSAYESQYDWSSDLPRPQALPSLRPGKPLLSSLILDWGRHLSIPIHCFMFRRSHFQTSGPFDAGLEAYEDFDLYMKLAAAGVGFVHHEDVQAVYRRHHPSVTGDRARMRRGFLLALGHATRRVSSRRVRLLINYRYAAEFERGLTDLILRRQAAVVCSTLSSQYRVLSALGMLAYPFLVCRRLIERSWRQHGGSLRHGESPVSPRALVARQTKPCPSPGNGSAGTETKSPRRLR